jgi:hypothetical protein
MPLEPPPREAWPQIALHTIGAGAFFFAMPYFALGSGLGTSLLWSVCCAAGAAALAWSQSLRR